MQMKSYVLLSHVFIDRIAYREPSYTSALRGLWLDQRTARDRSKTLLELRHCPQ